jgi:hypothetical protein
MNICKKLSYPEITTTLLKAISTAICLREPWQCGGARAPRALIWESEQQNLPNLITCRLQFAPFEKRAKANAQFHRSGDAKFEGRQVISFHRAYLLRL